MVDLKYIRKRKTRRIIAAVGASCAATAIILMAIALLGQRAAPLTITLSNSGAQLALSNFLEEDSNAIYLVAEQTPHYTEYCEEQLNLSNELLEIDDENSQARLTPNGEATLFYKYTFYVTNKGNSAANYDLTLSMSQPTKNATNRYDVDSILRVRFYENKVYEDEELNKHHYVTYAKKSAEPHEDENGNLSWKEEISALGGYAEEFTNSKTILTSTVTDLGPKEKIRYTFVFWLEGDDPQCMGEAPVDSALILGVEISARKS